jgi:hypothetical protein
MGEKEEIVISEPKAGAGDAAHLAVRMALSSIPVVGGAALELFNTVIAPPLAKRQAEWMESIAVRLTELEKKVDGFKIENLQSNDNFISTIFYSTALAVRNHQEEKLEALRNAVLNTAIASKFDDNLSHMFLNCIDYLTPLHVLVLKYFESPTQWVKDKNIRTDNYAMGGAITIFDIAFPELAEKKDFAKQIVSDLSDRGLAGNWESMHTMTNADGMYAPRITSLGKQFLAFISSPIKEA